VQLLKKWSDINCRAFHAASFVIFSFIYKNIVGSKKDETRKKRVRKKYCFYTVEIW